MVTNLHKEYRAVPLIEDAKADDLMSVLEKMRAHWPNATCEGSTGYIRSYFEPNSRLMIGYAWRSSQRKTGQWNYLVFKEPQHW